jgi:uncharacterized protein with PIN domain
MKQVWFRFYEELNDFLPASRKKQSFAHTFEGNPSVKDMIESLGVPHTEVDIILVNGISVDFSCKVSDGDIISVYPVFESLDVANVQRLREKPLRDVKFILDVHLGKLAKYLRLLGFDSLYETTFSDEEIISRSVEGKRIILTRDKILLRNRRVTHGYWIRSDDPGSQVKEVINRLDLRKKIETFTRCLECNSLIELVSRESIEDRLPPKTRQYYNEFFICPGCGRIYWKGSHYERMKEFAESIKGH